MVVKTEERFRSGCAWLDMRVIKSGLPDFIIEKDNKVLFVEIKSKEAPELSMKQFDVFRYLQELGFPIAVCYDGDINYIYEFDSYFGNNITNYYDRDIDPEYKGKKPKRIDVKKTVEILTILKIKSLIK